MYIFANFYSISSSTSCILVATYIAPALGLVLVAMLTAGRPRPWPQVNRRPLGRGHGLLALGVARCAVLRDRHAAVVERWVKEVVIGPAAGESIHVCAYLVHV